jgi:arylsulfatase A-like enzyme/Flp pilus assembly protein TadD
MVSVRISIALLVVVVTACSSQPDLPPTGGQRPSILLVTLDTTRADAIGPEAAGVRTPSFNAIAARGMRFRQAYATVPETLPSHASMMTGLYPAGHGIHENARALTASHPVLAERLRENGYRTAAFVSAFVLAGRFGLARGFDLYDDDLPAGAAERTSKDTTDRAIAYLAKASTQPLLLWVHYFDPHTPYAPEETFRARHPDNPYLGEIEAMDAELGRLIAAFDAAAANQKGTSAIIVAADHGEGLGDHGESQHGNLLYQSTMHVPLLMAGPGVAVGVNDTPVSTRRIFHTVLDWAGLGADDSLRAPSQDVVLGEAMKPFLSYGWQPQIMAVRGAQKAIFAGRLETYDLSTDPREQNNLGAGTSLPIDMRKALDDYPVPSLAAKQAPESLSEEARRSLASLGYVSGTATPIVRKDAPRPADMTSLLPTIEHASTLFVQERYREAIPLFKRVLTEDPQNLDAALRLATSYSSLGQDAEALAAFKRAAAIAPASDDARLYLALHYARGKDWPEAAGVLERIVAEQPERVAALKGLATVREKQQRLPEAVELRRKAYALEAPPAAEWIHLGELAMAAGQTDAAIQAFEKARAVQGVKFANDLELGVLYLSARRLVDARDALDRVPAKDLDYPMALFKRAQVSVLLNEPDQASRIARARQHADSTTRALIAREKLFQGIH